MLYLKKEDYEKILAHCKEGLPNEACGLIGDRRRQKKYSESISFNEH